MVPNWFLDHLQPFLVKPFLDQVPNKGFALLAAGQFETRLQELGLRGSSLMAADKPCPQLQPSLLAIALSKIVGSFFEDGSFRYFADFKYRIMWTFIKNTRRCVLFSGR